MEFNEIIPDFLFKPFTNDFYYKQLPNKPMKTQFQLDFFIPTFNFNKNCYTDYFPRYSEEEYVSGKPYWPKLEIDEDSEKSDDNILILSKKNNMNNNNINENINNEIILKTKEELKTSTKVDKISKEESETITNCNNSHATFSENASKQINKPFFVFKSSKSTKENKSTTSKNNKSTGNPENIISSFNKANTKKDSSKSLQNNLNNSVNISCITNFTEISDANSENSSNIHFNTSKSENNSACQVETEENESQKKREKVFYIEKFLKKKKSHSIIHKKYFLCRKKKGRKPLADWSQIEPPKAKFFNVDKKKHRIIYQKSHMKVIYSICSLAPPFNFEKYYDLIKKHVTEYDFSQKNTKKSFHLIKLKNEECEAIVDYETKLRLLNIKFNNRKKDKKIENNNNYN